MTKTVLITGGSLGIGLELAKQFAKDAYRLVLVAKPEAELAAAKQLLETTFSVEVFTYSINLATPEAPQTLYQWTKTLPFQIDVLVNNAGVGTGGDFTQISVERELDMIQLNVLTVYHLTRLFLQDMIARDNGKILNVASIAALQPSPGLSTYAATKAFVYQFTMGFNFELRERGSKVSLMALCPPPAKTGFQTAAKMENYKLFESRYIVTAEQIARKGYAAFVANDTWCIPDNFSNLLMRIGNRILPTSLKMRFSYNTIMKGDIL
jgi:uncharacterized protein